MQIQEYCKQNLINADCQYLEDNIIIVDEKIYQIIEPKNGLLVDEDFKYLNLDQDDHIRIQTFKTDFFLFCFGGQWYYYPIQSEEIQLNVFKYISKALQQTIIKHYSFLGCHTGYELCNGSQLPEDWVRKAKFLGINTLASCESNTLAGVLKFQDECIKQNIKSILAETVSVKNDNEMYELKLYVKSEIGWQNLININSQINVVNQQYVEEQFVLDHSEGLICVVSCSKKLDDKFVKSITKAFDTCFYQIDTVEYQSNEKDQQHLLCIQNYLKNWLTIIPPILICDAYYLDQEDYEIKNLLNKVGKIGFKYQSKDQHFKTLHEINIQLGALHKDDHDAQQFIELFEECVINTKVLSDLCNFKIRKDELHLPMYEMDASQKKQFKTNEDLFFHLIEQGMKERIAGKVANEDIYYERLETEISIMKKGNLIDYFLILWDILNWCKKNNILTGTGRGSAASSLVVYLLYVTHLDPIRYKLIFERFLNEARLKSLPDIDVDFESGRRDEVKQYIQEKYSFDNVCCIGTFNNFKIKSCIKDLSREMNVDYSQANFISSLISKDFEDGKLIDLFKCSIKEPKLKNFINENHKLIKAMSLILFQPKVKSIHAAGVIVTPKYKNKKTIHDLLPVRVEDGILISEWDKLDVDATGFLKEDILGLHQLDKINDMMKLIKKNKNIDVDLFSLDVVDQKVFEYFQAGLTEDVFQFNTDVQKRYMLDLKPTTIEELVAANALNRPGPMESGAHTNFVKIKDGKIKAEYDKLLEDVTADTYGLYAFQEQVMMAYKVITDCTLTDADTFRKITSKIGKWQPGEDKIEKSYQLFITSYVKKGVTEEYAQNVWNKMISFCTYGFNIAHSASYAVLGYYSLWFKVYYPLEFWTVSLQYSKEELISAKLTEIDQAGLVTVIAPDINNSNIGFTCDVKTNKIYWSIASVSFAGEVAVGAILEERNKNGKFKSLKDFLARVNKSKANKRVVHSLILAGCFDEVENVVSAQQRYDVFVKYYKTILNDDLPEEFTGDIVFKETFWQLKAKEICGYGYVDYRSIYSGMQKVVPGKYKYYNAKQINEMENVPDGEIFALGNINSIEERMSKRGKYAKLMLDDNNILFQVVLWNETYEAYIDKLKQNTIIGVICKMKRPDKYYSNNGLQTTKNSKVFFA